MTSGRKTALERPTLTGGGTSLGTAGPAATPALTILHHPHPERVGERALLPAPSAGGLSVSRAEPAFAPSGEPLGVEHVSRKPILLTATVDGGVTLDLGESSTAVLTRGKRIQGGVHFSAAQVRRGVVLELGHRVVLLLHTVTTSQRALGGAPDRPRELAGESDGMQQVLWEICNVADLDVPVLLRGETGSGKELVARALHQASARREQPFLAVNLGAVAPSLATAELFGAERGAFTGARRQPGYVEQARGGTLLLDEIGEAPVELQVALLRFLETGEAQTVGAQVRRIDVRIIAATDADLEAKVAAGTFRAPLLNRLSTYELSIPPLRARRDDIGRLFVRFLREELERVGEGSRLLPQRPEEKPWLPASLVARLADHDWPGNVRQLRNVVRQLVIGNRGKERLELTPAIERLLAQPAPSERVAGPEPPAPRGAGADAPRAAGPDPPAPRVAPEASEQPDSLDAADTADAEPSAPRRAPGEVTERELLLALRATRWNVSAAAKQLGITRPSLYMLMKRYDQSSSAQAIAPEEILRCYRECAGDLARMAERLKTTEWSLGQWVRKLGLE
ncbi:ATPase AAA [Sorangium cellulosum]|uniref:ATPase AAA n=1 Tax=Sorangium cellulosum TaxID=56 RepID=A0A2L0EZT4_SORCE|nr:sigma 54-interacting transcriptional regulator [Sorangium cellulosum]AUX44749.1 ATPase AAA [Sorangium cellulosum]